jgi:hypothetical protein
MIVKETPWAPVNPDKKSRSLRKIIEYRRHLSKPELEEQCALLEKRTDTPGPIVSARCKKGTHYVFCAQLPASYS